MVVKGLYFIGGSLLAELIAESFNMGIINIFNLSGIALMIPISIIMFFIIGVVFLFKN